MAQSPPGTPGYYAQIVDALGSGVLTVDAQGHILLVNPAALAHLGMPAERLRPGADVHAMPGFEFIVEILEDLRRTGVAVSRKEWEVQGAGGPKIMGLSASPLLGSDTFDGAIFLFTDLTEVRRLERAAEVNRQLAQIGELTAGIVHELRNPVSVVSGMAELLIRQLQDQPLLEKRAQAVFDEAGHMEKLISQFLSFAKPFEAKRTRCSFDEVLERVQTLCSRLATQRQVSVETRLLGLGLFLDADPSGLVQALANLLRNALEASPPQSTVTLLALSAANESVFRIEDAGPGIHLEPGEDLFSPFFSRKEGGTGLGLSIVQRIVAAHAGSVHCGNLEAKGAFFEIRLPKLPH